MDCFLLVIDTHAIAKDTSILCCVDVAGGMPDDMKEYINSQQENEPSVISKIGLGLILING